MYVISQKGVDISDTYIQLMNENVDFLQNYQQSMSQQSDQTGFAYGGSKKYTYRNTSAIKCTNVLKSLAEYHKKY